MAAYEVSLLDAAGQVIAVLDTTVLVTLHYARVLNGVAACQVTLRADHPAAPLFGKDRLIEINRYPSPRAAAQHEGTYLVRYRRRYEDEDGVTWLIASGVSLEYLLLVRHIDPRNDPLVAGGYSTKEGPADDVIGELVAQQAGAGAGVYQRVPDLSVAASGHIGKQVAGRWQWENLLDELQKLARTGAVDFYLRRGTGLALEFVCERVGADLRRNYAGAESVIFTPAFGNMRSPDLTEDWKDEKTYVYLLGQGTETERDVYEQMSGHLFDTPYGYAAQVADARQVKDGDATEYLTQALEELAKGAAKVEFSFEVTQAEQQYRRLWDVGDRVTAAWLDYEADLRITGVEVEVSESDERVTPKLEAI